MNAIFIAALSSFCGLMIGLAITRRVKEREEYFREICGLCSYLISNISYRSDKLASILSAATIDSPALKKNVDEYIKFLGGGEFDFSGGFLSARESSEVKQFLSDLGRYDGETQISELKRREGEFNLRYTDIKEKNDKQGSMFLKLGLLFGLLVGILLM